MDKLVARSRISRRNTLIMGISLALVVLLAASSIYRWAAFGIRQPYELLIEIFLAAIIVGRIWASYEYSLDADRLAITRSTPLGRAVYEVPLRDIVGVYGYKPKLIGVVRFRRTFRLQSALDDRPVWTVAYTTPAGKNRENRRIYFKPGEEFLDAMKRLLPGRVMVTEEQVITEMISREK